MGTLAKYGCRFSGVPRYVGFSGGPLRVYEIVAYGSGPAVMPYNSLSRCPSFSGVSLCGKWFGSPNGLSGGGFNELNGWGVVVFFGWCSYCGGDAWHFSA